jgi:hypothetical protein
VSDRRLWYSIALVLVVSLVGAQAADPPGADPPNEEPTVLKLPEGVAQIVAGGDGRFLLLVLPKSKQVAVLDVKEGKLIKYLPAPDEDFFLAAGRDYAFMVLNKSATLQRWSLATFKKEATVKLPDDGPFAGACVGVGSNGPMLLFTEAGTRALLVNPITMRSTKVEAPLPANPQTRTLRASPDGRTFLWATGSPFNVRQALLTVQDGKPILESFAIVADTSMIPGNGGRLYGQYSVYSAQLRPRELDSPTRAERLRFVPAADSGVFMEIETQPRPSTNLAGWTPGTRPKRIHVYVDGQAKPLGNFGKLGDVDASAEPLYHLCPRYGRLVTRGRRDDELLLHPFDLDAILEKSKVDYLFVPSAPPVEVIAGTGFEYTPVVKSKRGKVKVTLDAGPEGMKLGADGKLTWTAPADAVKQEVGIILTVSDASGDEILHTFKLAVVAAPTQKPALAEPPAANRVGGGQPPPALTFPIAPPKFRDDSRKVTLPDRFERYCVAGGGRFVIFTLPKAKKLAVFDVCAADVVKTLPLEEADAHIAATARHLFVLNPKADTIQRWDLATFKKEATVDNTVKGSPINFLAGHASMGPVYLNTLKEPGVSGELTPLDPVTLQPLKDVAPAPFGRFVGARVSANGAVIALYHKDHNGGTETFSFDGKKFERGAGGWFNMQGHTSPSPDGRTFYTEGGVVRSGKLTRGGYAAPAVDGNSFYLQIDVPDDALRKKPSKVYLREGDTTLAQFDRIDIPHGLRDSHWGVLNADQRVLFVESACALLVLPDGNEAVEVHKLDPWPLMDKEGGDYLLVPSNPPLFAVRGAPFAYAPTVRSKKGGAQVKLEAGPEGMTVAKGVVSWAVPKEFASTSAGVILRITDDSGATVFHPFTLKVIAAADCPAPLPAGAAAEP